MKIAKICQTKKSKKYIRSEIKMLMKNAHHKFELVMRQHLKIQCSL